MINNQLPTITPTENAKARYALAKASNRILARVIDICIVLIFSIGFGLAIIATDKVGLKHAFELAQTWRYFLIALESSTILFLYFLLVPYLTKGRTIGLLLLKLRIYNLVPTKNFFINLLKREFFLWIIVAVTSLGLGIALWCLSSENATNLLKGLTLSDNNSDQANNKAAVAIFQTLYGISFLILLFVIVHMCVYNKRRCFIDHVSDTVVIKLVDIASNDSNASANVKATKRRRNYGLPGEIVAGAENEIDSL